MRRGCSRRWWATPWRIDATGGAGPPAAQCGCRRCGVWGRARAWPCGGAIVASSRAATGRAVRVLASACRPIPRAIALPRGPAASAAAAGVGACWRMRYGRRSGRRSGRVGIAARGGAVGTFSSARHRKSPIDHSFCPARRAFFAARRVKSPARRPFRVAVGTFSLACRAFCPGVHTFPVDVGAFRAARRAFCPGVRRQCPARGTFSFAGGTFFAVRGICCADAPRACAACPSGRSPSPSIRRGA